jgi:glycosyltransferase involved in cell wall biosynthesis
MPPARTGIAACSADLVSALGDEHAIDVFVDQPVAQRAPGTRSAHDFLWLHRRQPYDLTVYQVGNSSCHDYLWPYLFRFPGLAVLHDVRLHHARAGSLLRRGLADAYRQELACNHPLLDPAVAELAVSGFDNHLYSFWPMVRLLTQASRRVAVHTAAAATELRDHAPDAAIDVIHLGHGVQLPAGRAEAARTRRRAALGLPPDAFVFGCFGGLTPEKRLPQILDAFAATLSYAPSSRLLLAGEPSRELDLRRAIDRRGLGKRAVLTGYLESDEELTECIAACDAALTLRWPTAGEISGPWLRCLALGLPTVVIDLPQLALVPSLDPRTWQPHGGVVAGPPVCIAVDILDEDHSLGLAMRRLATHPPLREQLGRAAAAYWKREHSVDIMINDYRHLIARAIASPVPHPRLPRHLEEDGSAVLDAIAGRFGLGSPWSRQ